MVLRQAVSTAPVPFFVSCGAVFLWTVLAVCTLGRLLPDMWVERATVEAAMSLGATATALLTLRMVRRRSLHTATPCWDCVGHVAYVGLCQAFVLLMLRAGASGRPLPVISCTQGWASVWGEGHRDR